jgi:hypothetical protein
MLGICSTGKLKKNDMPQIINVTEFCIPHVFLSSSSVVHIMTNSSLLYIAQVAVTSINLYPEM